MWLFHLKYFTTKETYGFCSTALLSGSYLKTPLENEQDRETPPSQPCCAHPESAAAPCASFLVLSTYVWASSDPGKGLDSWARVSNGDAVCPSGVWGVPTAIPSGVRRGPSLSPTGAPNILVRPSSRLGGGLLAELAGDKQGEQGERWPMGAITISCTLTAHRPLSRHLPTDAVRKGSCFSSLDKKLNLQKMKLDRVRERLAMLPSS